MQLKILGSSSAANGYILDNGKQALLIECGCPFQDVQKAVGFEISRIAGAIISHEHGDHARHVHKVLAARIPCHMSEGTAKALNLCTHPLVVETKAFESFTLAGFTIKPFPVQHDAAEPFGYLIHHQETGTILFATDTYYLKYRFKALTNILIECNYRLDILQANLQAGRITPPQRNRTIQSHLSYHTCKDILLANNLSQVNNIVLIHLSPANSNPTQFLQGIQELTGKNIHIAQKGMVIHFDKSPF